MSTRQDAIPNPGTSFLVPLFLVTIGAAYISMLMTSDESGYPYLFLLMLVQAAPLVFRATTRTVDFMSFVLINHFVSYSVAKLNQLVHLQRSSVIHPESLHAMQELLICTILIIATYYCFRGFLFNKGEKADFRPIEISPLAIHGIGLFIVFHSQLSVLIKGSFRSIELVFFYVALVHLMTAKTDHHKRWLYFYRGLAIFSGLNHFLRTGMLAHLASIGMVMFLAATLQKKFKAVIVLSTVAIALCVIQPVKGIYRNVISGDSSISIMGRFSAIYDLVGWKYFDTELSENTAALAGIDLSEISNTEELEVALGDDGSSNRVTLAQGFARIGDDSLERVLSWTPNTVPYWGGESYANIPFIFIPRLVWPNKPKWTFWNKFGRTYGFLSSDDYHTSVGVGFLGEAYMNFGQLGMYFCAIFFAMLVLAVEKMAHTYYQRRYALTFICFLTTVITFGQSMGAIVHSIVYTAVFLVIFRYTVLRNSVPRPA